MVSRDGRRALARLLIDSVSRSELPVRRDPAAAPGVTVMPSREVVPAQRTTDRDLLEQELRALQERLSFYEGFDLLIQDNVTQARELFRRAAQERETAAATSERVRREASEREAALRAELASIGAELDRLAQSVKALSARVARVLGATTEDDGWNAMPAGAAERPLAVVVHGVPSARTALSLQRFIASLPQVADVSAREFVGGVLRLDARVQDRLLVDQFSAWGDPRRIEPLTERADVIEFALQEPAVLSAGD
jgi:hypothetical protein